jgi:hypothetical protein
MFKGRTVGMPSICIATSYDRSFRDIGDYAAMTCRLYARRHGYTVHIDDNAKCERHPAWHRVMLIPALLDKGYNYVLWLDADAMFVRFDRDIAEVITGKHDLYLAQHDHPAHQTKVPNTGVMLVRNSLWSHTLFRKLWTMDEYVNHNWWENAAMIKTLGYHSLLGEGPNVLAEDVLSHIKFLDYGIWNFIPSICADDGDPVIRHYAGFAQEERRVEVPRQALAACFRALEDIQSFDATPNAFQRMERRVVQPRGSGIVSLAVQSLIAMFRFGKYR